MNPAGPESSRLPGAHSLPDALRALESALGATTPEVSGTAIGPYKLLQKLGEGGFGVVWMAEQLEPIRRRVALKIIKTGMDTEDVIARFEAERQALALMDHPNIARVFEAGATSTGRPFFVMELVRGIAITRYCDENRLSPVERLRLFIAVCKAVQHAHQKAIIHRDLKPSNILVALHDGAPVPKIIDFGIAKATDKQLTDKTLFTQFHAFIGTPAYTSPEQMEMSALDVDTRSDIYSLGVLLYELLAGRPPFDPDALVKSGLDEMRRTIREVDPPRPSTRLRTLADHDRTWIAGQRRTDPAKLSMLLRGDLDWIAMRCLEKDRTRRYETANALARDVERHLAHEPVSARPPSTLYRAQKFVRRHKLGVAAALAITVSLVGGLIASSMLFMRERAARTRAVAAEASENKLRQQAEVAGAAEAKRASRTSLALAERLLRDPGQAFEGIAHLVRAARADPSNYNIGPRLISAIASRSFAEPMGEPLRHPMPVSWAGYCNDGRRCLSAAGDSLLRYWDLASGKLLQTIDAGEFTWCALSADSRHIAVVGVDGGAHIWNIEIGRKVLGPLRHGSEAAVVTAKFSPDNQWLVTGGTDRMARIWNATTGELHATLQDRDVVRTIAFSPDGARVLTGAEWWRVWRMPDGASTPHPIPPIRQLSTLVKANFSPDGALVVVTNTAGAQLFDPVAGKLVGTPLNHESASNFADFSPDGKKVVTTSPDTTARVWEVPSGKALFTLRHASGTVTARFTPDSRYLLVRCEDGTAHVWDLMTGERGFEPVRAGERAHEPSGVGDVARGDLSPDGAEFMTSGRDGIVRRWRLTPGAMKPLVVAPSPNLVAVAPNQRGAATAWLVYPDRMQKIDLVTGRWLGPARIFPVKIADAVLAPDELHLLVRMGERTSPSPLPTELWNLKGAEIIRKSIPSPTGSIRFSEDSSLLLTGSVRGPEIWNTNTGSLVAGPLNGLIEFLADCSFSPDGRLLALINLTNVILFDVASGTPVGEPLRHRGGPRSPAFSPEGRLLATTSDDGTAQLWDVSTGRPIGQPMLHQGGMRGVRFTHDGTRLVTWTRREARVWEVPTGRPLTEGIEGGNDMGVPSFSEDDAVLAICANAERTVRIWNSATGQLHSEPMAGIQTGTGPYNRPSFHLSSRLLVTLPGLRASAVPPSSRQPVPDWLLRLGTALAGGELDAQAVFREQPYDAKVFDQLHRELAALPGDAPYVEWGRWILADRATRSIAPGFEITKIDAERLATSLSGAAAGP